MQEPNLEPIPLSHTNIGVAPGTLREDPTAEPPRVFVIAYGPDVFEEMEISDIEELRALLGKRPVLWVNVDGVGHAPTIQAIGEIFGLHRLALEDVTYPGQRPKVEEYKDHLFLVAQMVEPGERIRTEQLSIFLGEGYVLTFQEHKGDCLDPVRKRAREIVGRIRNMGADYLPYCILDAVVVAYFPQIDEIDHRLEQLENEVIDNPTTDTVAGIHAAKRDLLTIRHVMAPQREALNMLLRETAGYVTDTTRVYLRDCYDHVIRVSEAVDTHREIAAGLLDVYLSSVSNRMNDIMKVLTVIATMFIPLTFLAGIYGMNFDPGASPWNMPELRAYFGYPLFLLGIAGIAALELLFFWRKGWLGGRSTRKKD